MEEVKSMPCKRCSKCGEVKDLSEFYKCSKRCKECCKKASRDADQFAKDSTEKGVIRVLYKTQKRHSKARGHPAPSYTKNEFRKWLYDNGYKELYDAWVQSGYDKWKKPSCDRIDDSVLIILGSQLGKRIRISKQEIDSFTGVQVENVVKTYKD